MSSNQPLDQIRRRPETHPRGSCAVQGRLPTESEHDARVTDGQGNQPATHDADGRTSKTARLSVCRSGEKGAPDLPSSMWLVDGDTSALTCHISQPNFVSSKMLCDHKLRQPLVPGPLCSCWDIGKCFSSVLPHLTCFSGSMRDERPPLVAVEPHLLFGCTWNPPAPCDMAHGVCPPADE